MSLPSPEDLRFREQRRSALQRSRLVRGLDFIEVQSHPGDDPVWRLRLHFLPSRPQGLTTGDLRVVDPTGEVDPAIQVTRIGVDQRFPNALDVFVRVPDPELAKRMRADSSPYTLKVVAPGFDRFFQEAQFRFDGQAAGGEPRAEPSEPFSPIVDIDYLAKDYESFRRVMLERMATNVPEWTERNPADLGVAIVEVLAYAADYLSYYQDAVATEAYLDTARKRSSVRRHLRLLGHSLHEGCNARVWARVEIGGQRPIDLPAGTALLTRAGSLPALLLEESRDLGAALRQGSLTFETLYPVRLWPRLNRMSVHSWGAADYTLPSGATSVALSGHFHELEAGDVLVLEQVNGEDGEVPDPRVRHAVRLRDKPKLSVDSLASEPITELEFFDEDALPFAMVVSAKQGEAATQELLVARGNIVLADHGRTVSEELPSVVGGEPYRPVLSSTEITRREPFDPKTARDRPAASVSQRPERAVPDVTLVEVVGDGNEPASQSWHSRVDLLESQKFSAEFVAETESDSSVRLRFGDGRQGRRPAPGTRFVAAYRIGNGPDGHIGHDSLAHVVSASDLPIIAAGNPLPAQGAAAPEELERARLVVPSALGKTENCVTPDDLSQLAESYPSVLHAVAEPRWTGSWETLFLFVQRSQGRRITAEFERGLRELIEPRLLAGADLEIRPPSAIPLEIRLRGVVEPQAVVSTVRGALLERLGSADSVDGRRGYFHPDSFTFGQSVHLDGVLDEAMKVAGIVSIDAEVFRTWEGSGAVRSSIEPGPFEVVSLENRPAEPQFGILDVVLEAGL